MRLLAILHFKNFPTNARKSAVFQRASAQTKVIISKNYDDHELMNDQTESIRVISFDCPRILINDVEILYIADRYCRSVCNRIQ